MNAFKFLDEIGPVNTNTMVLDKALGYKTVEDMLTISGNYFNLLKYGWGTSILYDEEIIKDKNELYHSYNIRTYTGGTLFELANKQNKIDDSVYMENYETLQKQINEIMLLIRQPINMEEVWQSQKYGQ